MGWHDLTQGLWSEWAEKPAGYAKAFCGIRCPTHCMLLNILREI